MEQRKSKRSLRVALVMGAAVAGTALVGWGGLAAWQAYTQNAGNTIAAGTLSHTNTVGTGTACNSGTTVVNCDTIISVTGIGPTWTGTGTADQVTIASTGSLNSSFAMSMPAAPVKSAGAASSLCSDLSLTVTDSAGTVYSGSLGSQMSSTPLSPSNADSPWATNDTNTYTFTVAPSAADWTTNAAYAGGGCTFDVLFDQTSA